uniref:Uncharacterized protein n=1 Tax=Setaria digitata TaxID=48799 RepID=A0A915PI48_9BILA
MCQEHRHVHCDHAEIRPEHATDALRELGEVHRNGTAEEEINSTAQHRGGERQTAMQQAAQHATASTGSTVRCLYSAANVPPLNTIQPQSNLSFGSPPLCALLLWPCDACTASHSEDEWRSNSPIPADDVLLSPTALSALESICCSPATAALLLLALSALDGMQKISHWNSRTTAQSCVHPTRFFYGKRVLECAQQRTTMMTCSSSNTITKSELELHWGGMPIYSSSSSIYTVMTEWLASRVIMLVIEMIDTDTEVPTGKQLSIQTGKQLTAL